MKETNFLPSTVKDAVHAAIAFFDQFDYPLTLAEIERYMLGVKASGDELRVFLDNDPMLDKRDGYYFMTGRQGILNVRLVRERIAQEYWKKVRRFVPLARIVPFVRAIAVCNTLAFNCPTAQSDIDLFVLTKSGRIFTARTGMTMLFALLGVRRHGKKVAGRFCLSFFLADSDMNLESMKRGNNDVYLLYWFRTLKPVYGRDAFHEFMEANSWLDRHFQDYSSVDTSSIIDGGRIAGFIGMVKKAILSTPLGNMLESLLRKNHLSRHAGRMADLGPESDVVVSDAMLKYHNIDRRNELNNAFFERFSRLSG